PRHLSTTWASPSSRSGTARAKSSWSHSGVRGVSVSAAAAVAWPGRRRRRQPVQGDVLPTLAAGRAPPRRSLPGLRRGPGESAPPLPWPAAGAQPLLPPPVLGGAVRRVPTADRQAARRDAPRAARLRPPACLNMLDCIRMDTINAAPPDGRTRARALQSANGAGLHATF